jgi:hypothetical protein
MSGQPHAAVDGGQREARERAGEQCLPARPAEHEADARGQLGVTQAHAVGPDEPQGEVEAGEGGGSDGSAGEAVRLVRGERGHSQQGERAGERRGGQPVRKAVDGHVDQGERDGDQGEPGERAQLPTGRRAGGHDG